MLRRPLLYPTELQARDVRKWSGRADLNGRPPAPKAGALPGCATPRRGYPISGPRRRTRTGTARPRAAPAPPARPRSPDRGDVGPRSSSRQLRGRVGASESARPSRERAGTGHAASRAARRGRSWACRPVDRRHGLRASHRPGSRVPRLRRPARRSSACPTSSTSPPTSPSSWSARWASRFLARDRRSGGARALRHRGRAAAVLALFAGIGLTGVGSGYYHWMPDNRTLFWDRLPMTIGFMALLASVIGERISRRAGALAALAPRRRGRRSTLYWHLGEQRGAGDLRPYGLVQFGSLVLVPLILALFPARYTGTAHLVTAIGWYVLAKVFEYFDHGFLGLVRRERPHVEAPRVRGGGLLDPPDARRGAGPLPSRVARARDGEGAGPPRSRPPRESAAQRARIGRAAATARARWLSPPSRRPTARRTSARAPGSGRWDRSRTRGPRAAPR